jgi:hypothetical protein
VTLAIYRQPTLKRESPYQFCQLSKLFEESTIHGRSNMPPTPRPSLALESLPPRPKPSGSTAGITIQESTYNPLPPLRYLLRRRDSHSCALPGRQSGHLLQPLPHHGHVLSHAGFPPHRQEFPSRRKRTDRGARQRLGWLLRRGAQKQRYGRRGSQGLRLQHSRLRQMAQHPSHGDYFPGPL